MKTLYKKILFLVILTFFALAITGCVQMGFYDSSSEVNVSETDQYETKADSNYEQDISGIPAEYEQGEYYERDDSDTLESTVEPNPSEIYKGLWVSDTKDSRGRKQGMYFMNEEKVLLMGWIDKVQGEGYFIKGNPYSFEINSNGILVKAGYQYGAAIVEDEMRDGIPELEYDGENIVCVGGEYEGIVFSYASDSCEYKIDN